MHQDRIAGWPQPIGRPDTEAFDVQRRLLLELVTDPPPEGEPIGLLAAQLGCSSAAMSAAAVVLETVGLAERCRAGWRASPAARAFDALWPAAL